MAETAQAMGNRAAKYLDADDEERLPLETRVWAVNEARKRVLRPNDLRFGVLESTLAISVGDTQKTLPEGLFRLRQPPWFINDALKLVELTEEPNRLEFASRYPDPSDLAELSHYHLLGNTILFTPAAYARTLVLSYYGYPGDLKPAETDAIMTHCSTAVWWYTVLHCVDTLPGQAGAERYLAYAEDALLNLVIESGRHLQSASRRRP